MPVDVEQADTRFKVRNGRVGVGGRARIKNQLIFQPVIRWGVVVTEYDNSDIGKHTPSDVFIVAEFFWRQELMLDPVSDVARPITVPMSDTNGYLLDIQDALFGQFVDEEQVSVAAHCYYRGNFFQWVEGRYNTDVPCMNDVGDFCLPENVQGLLGQAAPPVWDVGICDYAYGLHGEYLIMKSNGLW
jgi:hypothetical protein